VAVAPAWLQGVSADEIKTIELKAFRRVGHGGSDDIAENVGFAAAGRTRAGATKDFQIQIRFGVVIPLNSQFVPDLLNVCRLQRH
jgi:hypothetical protein